MTTTIRIGPLRLTAGRSADEHYGIRRNIYYRGTFDQTTIGIAAHAGRRFIGVVWRRPPYPKDPRNL